MLWWFAQNFFIAAILACLVALVCRIWRVNPVARHAMWLIVLIKLVTPPLGAWPWAIRNPLEVPPPQRATVYSPVTVDQPILPSPQSFISDSTSVGTSVEIHIAPAPIVFVPTAKPAIIPPEPPQRDALALVMRLAIGIWIAGSVIFTLLQLLRIIGMMRRLRAAKPADGALAARVAELARQLSMRRIRVKVVSGIASPAIWAVARPVLLWPAELPQDMSDRAIRGLIVHELAHARRHDHWVGWLELIAGCIWWWNPLFWYVRHEVRENAELACDAWVVDTIPKGRRAYAEAILAVCENLSGRTVPPPSVGARTGGRRFLERRLAMILKEHFPLRLARFQWALVLVLALTSVPAWSQRAADNDAADATAKRLIDLKQKEADFADQRIAGYDRTMAVQMRRGARQAADVPDAATALINEFERQKLAIQMEMEEKLAQQREQLAADLKDLAAKLDQTGAVREAQAVRDYIARLKPASNVLADPGTLMNYRDRVGQVFVFEVVGQAAGGTIWGDGVYTDDSSIAMTAVHAGVLKDGERGMVEVRIMPGQASFQGAARNGVNSNPYGPWEGSYTIRPHRRDLVGVPAPGPVPVATTLRPPAPVQLGNFRDRVGQVVAIDVVGSNQGALWGNEIYTDDSSIAAAAVHAGILLPGQRGIVHVILLPGQESYNAAEKNGVTSQPWPAFGGSFKFVPAPKPIRKGVVQNDLLRNWVDGNRDSVHVTWNYYLSPEAGNEGDSSKTQGSKR